LTRNQRIWLKEGDSKRDNIQRLKFLAEYQECKFEKEFDRNSPLRKVSAKNAKLAEALGEKAKLAYAQVCLE